MPSIYVRIPHYVASWLRNRDEDHPIPVGQPHKIGYGNPLLDEVCFRADPNPRGIVNIDCFSERQWCAMMQGKALSYKRGFTFDIARSSNHRLTMAEIFDLSGHPEMIKHHPDTGALLPDTEYIDEYVPFSLPDTITRCGREYKTQTDWYLPYASHFIDLLREQFIMAITRFVAIDRKIARTLELPRSKMEAMDRFMCRYDIRTGVNEREQMKKLLNRSVQSSLYSIDADEPHALWSNEHLPEKQTPTNPRRVICMDNGEIFPSIKACAKALGVTRAAVAFAIEKGYRCRKLHLEFADE